MSVNRSQLTTTELQLTPLLNRESFLLQESVILNETVEATIQ